MPQELNQVPEEPQTFDETIASYKGQPQSFDEVIASYQQAPNVIEEYEKNFQQQLSYLDNLLYGARQKRQEVSPDTPEPTPDRGYFMEALAGIGSGTLGTFGSALSGIERIGERIGIDPSGDDAGWFRQAGNSLKKGAEAIKASPDKEVYFKLFNAFGSILGFAAPALIAAPVSGLAALGISGSLAAGTGADEAYERAENAKATDEQIDQAVGLGTVVGLTEILAPLRILKGLAKVFPDWDFAKKFIKPEGLRTSSTEELIKKTTKDAQGKRLAKILGVNDTGIKEWSKRVAKTAGLEGSQEFGAAVAQNAIEKYLYNPEVDLLNADAIEEGLYGGSAGSMLEGIISTFSLRKARGYRKKMNEFLESDNFKAINSEAEKAANEFTEAEKRIEELEKPENLTYNTSQKLGQAVGRRDRAAERIKRANSVMEKALNDQVYTSNEIVDYLASQVTTDKSGNEVPLYNKDYLKKLQRSDKENETSFLKDSYIAHVQNKRTKHEMDAEERLSSTVNPDTRTEYTFEEIETIKSQKGKEALSVEINARVDDAKRYTYEAQQGKIKLRNEYGMSAALADSIYRSFYYNRNNDSIQYINTVNEILTKDPTQSAAIKDIMEADTSLGVKKSRLTRLRNAQIKEEQRIKEEADKVEGFAGLTEEQINEAVKKGTFGIDPESFIYTNEDLEGFEEAFGPAKEKVDGIQTVLEPGSSTAGEGAKDVTPVPNTDTALTKTNTEGGKGSVNTESKYYDESLQAYIDLPLDQRGFVKDDEGKWVKPDTDTDESTQISNAFGSDNVSNKDIAKNENQKRKEDNQTQINEVEVIAKPDIKPDVVKDGDGTIVPSEVEANEEDNILKEDETGDLNDKYAAVLIEVENTQMPLDLVEANSNKEVFTGEDIIQAINDHGSGWVDFLSSRITTTLPVEFQKSALSYAAAVKTGFKQKKITQRDLDSLKGKYALPPPPTIDFDLNDPPDVKNPPETTVDDRVGQEKFKDLARAIGQMIGVSGSPKHVEETIQNGNRVTYKFANSETDNVTVVFKPFTEADNKDASGYFDSTVNTININIDKLNTWSSALGTTAHEGFHAAKKLLLLDGQIQEVFNKVLNPEVAEKNGWNRQTYESMADQRFSMPVEASYKNQLEFDTARREINDQKRAWLLEEAQAYLWGKWYRGDYVQGLTPPARNLMSIIKDFINQFANYARSFISREDIKVEKKEDLAALVLKQFEDLASGKLAEAVGRRNIPDGANLAANLSPETTQSILNSSVSKFFNNLSLSKNSDGAWGKLRDISNFTSLIAHNVDISRRSPVYDAFYSLIQLRTTLRNIFKVPAASLLEKSGIFKGIYQLNKQDLKSTAELIHFADEGSTEPVFTNLGTENATATITITQANLEDLVRRYEGKDIGEVDLLNPDLRVYRDTAINPSALRIEQVPTKEGDDVQNVYVMESTDTQVVHAFNGAYSAMKKSGDNQFAGLIHAFLNQPSMAGTSLNIRTLEENGRPRPYEEILEDVLSLKQRLKDEGLLDADGILKEEAYNAYQDRVNVENIPDSDRVLGGLPYDDSKSLKLKVGAKEAWAIINSITGEKRKGYFPHYRLGDAVVAVWRVDGSSRTLVRLESVNNNMISRFAKWPIIGDAAVKEVKGRQEELRKELTAEYGSADFDVKSFDLTLDKTKTTADEQKVVRQALGKIDQAQEIFTKKMDSESEKVKNIKSFADMIEKELLEDRIQGLTRERDNIPGYINKTNNTGEYFLNAMQRYIDSTANTASSLFTDNEIIKSIKDIETKVEGGRGSVLYRTAQNTFDYINDPNNEATLLRSYAFHSFLGWNLSSALVNLTQTVQATWPIISAIVGTRKGSIEVARSLKDTIKLYGFMSSMIEKAPRIGQYGFSFHKTQYVTNEEGVNIGTEVVIDFDKKPDWMDAGEFSMIAEFFKEGAIQPIQNMDLGASGISKRINTGNLKVDKALKVVLDSSGYAFGTIENVNRMTAALAAYRLSKKDAKDGNRKNWEAFAKGTRFNKPSSDQSGTSLESDTEEGQELFARRMALMAIEKSQFFMGKENRPRIFQGKLLSAATQFMTFPFQMVGTYATTLKQGLLGRQLAANLTEEEVAIARSIARKQLGLMTISILAFSGGMGLPFAENIKQLIKFITENFGEEIAYDVETGIRETLGPLIGETPTDMILRGPMRQMGFDMNRRVGYGEILALRTFMGGSPMDFAGPGVSRIFDQIEGINQAFRRGTDFGSTTAGVAQALTPLALANLFRATYQESTQGIRTRSGQHVLPPGYLNMGEKALMAFGLAPTVLSHAREIRGLNNYYDYRARNGKEKYTNILTNQGLQAQKAWLSNDLDAYQDHYADYLRTWDKVWKHDAEQTREDTKYNIRPSTVSKRIQKGLYPEMRLSKTESGRIQQSLQKNVAPTLPPR